MLPKIVELEFNNEPVTEDLPKMGKSFLFDFDKGDFVLKDGKIVAVEGIEALKMWIIKAIKTERYRFRIYDDTGYGTTIEDLTGTNYPRAFVESEIKREVTSSLTNHPYIENIINWEFRRDGKWMRVNFKVITMEGAFDQEVVLGAY
jgi:hypothetical protein